MIYGERELRLGAEGPDVSEIQIRLAGFMGTEPDGEFGTNTQTQVTTFQQDFMGIEPTGLVDRKTMEAIDDFASQYPFDFMELACPCGRCSGFGSGAGKGAYLHSSHTEKYHQYEYPGVHRMLLWAVRALFHYMPDQRFRLNSAYRCAHHNKIKSRTTTNHHGKAIDIEVVLQSGQNDKQQCDVVRQLLQGMSNAQIGWSNPNQKSLEPAETAPNWVHYDVRTYAPNFLQDTMFCTTLQALDQRLPIRI